uniref:EF-hand domain-containing protein n=1 Tax=Panagrolaimus sp. JU765 TaxID=591449 RepID=A0AC34QUC7_9BILA
MHFHKSNNHKTTNGYRYNKTTQNDSVEEYKRAFMFFDANNDGYITSDELERAMNKCGVYPTKLELRVIMAQADIDKNGVITFDEFVQLMKTQDSTRGRYSTEQLLEQFQLFDKDKDGFIEKQEMIEIVNELNLGRFFPMGVIDQLFQDADVDGDGRISFQEFAMAVN